MCLWEGGIKAGPEHISGVDYNEALTKGKSITSGIKSIMKWIKTVSPLLAHNPTLHLASQYWDIEVGILYFLSMILNCIQWVKKNGNWESILTISKSKRKIIKLLSENDSILNFSLIWYIGRSYWVRDGCSAIIFVKHVKTYFIQVLSTQCSADSWIVALLWMFPQIPSCSTNNSN